MTVKIAQHTSDCAFEAVRKKLCQLPRYSFLIDSRGNLRRSEDISGNWIEFDEAHRMFDPVFVDAALAAQPKADSEARNTDDMLVSTDAPQVAQKNEILSILKRLTAWAEALGPCTFSGAHPVAIARAFLDRNRS